MPESFAGSPGAIAQHLEEYRRSGLDYALCAFESEDLDDLLRQMRNFAEQVVPQLEQSGLANNHAVRNYANPGALDGDRGGPTTGNPNEPTLAVADSADKAPDWASHEVSSAGTMNLGSALQPLGSL